MSEQTFRSMYRRWTGPSVWDGRARQKDKNWYIDLSETDISLLQRAVSTSLSSSKPLAEQTQSDFDLEDFGYRLVALRRDVLDGCGFAVLRGLSSTWSDEELIRAYWIIGSWFGNPVSQNARADLLGHVIDQRAKLSGTTRIYQTSLAQPFHSDSCDIVGLLCLRPAKAGGESSIASSAAIHNHLLDHHLSALETLYQDFQCDRYGEIPEGKLAHYPVRVFTDIADKLVCYGMDADIRSAQRLDEVQPLTESQINALDTFQSTARTLSLNMMLERGDIQLVNNLSVVHAREAFEDFADSAQRRYLIRLWLSSPLGRVLPEFMRERWGNITSGELRGGILVPGATPTVNLSP